MLTTNSKKLLSKKDKKQLLICIWERNIAPVLMFQSYKRLNSNRLFSVIKTICVLISNTIMIYVLFLQYVLKCQKLSNCFVLKAQVVAYFNYYQNLFLQSSF